MGARTLRMSAKISRWFPWTKSPLICNGPMLGVATPKLAVEVSKAGGLGFLASTVDVSPSSADLGKLAAELAECKALLASNNNKDSSSSSSSGGNGNGNGGSGGGSQPISVGVSFITGHESIGHFAQTALPVLREATPAAVWLFAPTEEAKPHRAIISALKTLAPRPPTVFVQVGNVAAAREAVDDGAEVVVAQGIDAGGHQFRRGMGVVSFVPELKDTLANASGGGDGDGDGDGDGVAVLAAGGIVDERGVAAALALGADGVVMGTRFTVAEESVYPEFRKKLVLETVDGASSTLKSPFNDQLSDLTLWGPLYDGRAIVTTIHKRFLAGETLEDLKESLAKDYATDEAAKLVKTWAGTGVGLVKDIKPAGEIVRQVREGAKAHLAKTAQQWT